MGHPDAFAIDENTGLMLSLGTCLTQELQRFNLLLKKMASTISDLQKAIKGLIVMTGELDAMFNSILNNQLPGLWEKVGYPSLKPLSSWYEDMILRVEFFRDWIQNGIPMSFWVSSFYFPQGFLTSVLQGYSRKNVIPVDQLGWQFIMQDTSDPNDLDGKPEEGIYIHGLFMDGCAFDYEATVLSDQQFGVIYVQAPVINFVQQQNVKTDPKQYQCPVYKTSVRAGTLSTTGHSTNFVLFLAFDTEEDPSYWILKGAALLTMLND